MNKVKARLHNVNQGHASLRWQIKSKHPGWAYLLRPDPVRRFLDRHGARGQTSGVRRSLKSKLTPNAAHNLSRVFFQDLDALGILILAT